jgi:hypothetical protein
MITWYVVAMATWCNGVVVMTTRCHNYGKLVLCSKIGCALFPNLYGLNPGLIELTELRPGISSFFKLENGKCCPLAFESYDDPF